MVRSLALHSMWMARLTIATLLLPRLPIVATVVLAAIMKPWVEVADAPAVVDVAVASTSPLEVPVVVESAELVSRLVLLVLVARPPPPRIVPAVTMPVMLPVQVAPEGQQATYPLTSAVQS